MKSPFIISFTRSFDITKKDEIVRLFLKNLEITSYKKTRENNDIKISINERIVPLNPFKSHSRFWVMFTNKAELKVKDNLMIYSINSIPGVLFMLIYSLFSLLSFYISFEITLSGNHYVMLIPFFVFLCVYILSYIYKIIIHRREFYRAVELKSRYKGSYNWSKILENKTDYELKQIVNGDTSLTGEVQKMAKIELQKRNNSNK